MRIFLLSLVISFFSFDVAVGQQQVSFAVEKSGQGRPLIFIHGLFGAAGIWQEAVDHYKKDYTCYNLTLPGFGGQPAVMSDSILRRVTHDLAAFIRQEKLEKPVIIGHSLGGWLALQLGSMYPELPGKIVVVSMGPFPAAFFLGHKATVDSSRGIAQQMKTGITSTPRSGLRQYQLPFMKAMIRDTGKIPMALDIAMLADLPTQGQVMYELYTTDLRPEMKKVKAPVLVLGDWAGSVQYGVTHQRLRENLAEQYKLTPKLQIEISDNAYHFIMLDEPVWFYEQTDAFIRL